MNDRPPLGRDRSVPDYDRHPVFSRRPGWRRTLHRVIFGHDTPGGKLFDILLLVAILASVAAVMAESVDPVRARYGSALRAAEWVFTVLFTIEYILRLASAERASGYARSFYGIIDLLAVLPTYLSLLIPGGQALAVIRILRVLRVFRILKLGRFVGGEQVILRALRQSAHKIIVFLIAVVTIVVVVGAAMYFIEGDDSGFTSIPAGVYWSIVTLTTVGFGDITPVTVPGQILASLLMVLGYAIIAVPTGIVTAEMVHGHRAGGAGAAGAAGTAGAAPASDAGAMLGAASSRGCAACGFGRHDADAVFCKRCGTRLEP